MDTLNNASAYPYWSSRQDKCCQFSSTLLRACVCISRCHSQNMGLGHRRVWTYFEESYQSSIRLSIWLNGQSPRWVICRYVSANVHLMSRIATCSDDLFIKLWNVPDDYKNFATLRGHEHSISSVCFLPGDNQLISSSRDITVRVWEVSTRCMIDYRAPYQSIRSLIWMRLVIVLKFWNLIQNGYALQYRVLMDGYFWHVRMIM